MSTWDQNKMPTEVVIVLLQPLTWVQPCQYVLEDPRIPKYKICFRQQSPILTTINSTFTGGLRWPDSWILLIFLDLGGLLELTMLNLYLRSKGENCFGRSISSQTLTDKIVITFFFHYLPSLKEKWHYAFLDFHLSGWKESVQQYPYISFWLSY